MKGILLFLAAGCVAAASAGPYLTAISPAALVSGQSGGDRAPLLSTGFESPFVVGYVGGQQGWVTFSNSTAQPRISTTHPKTGSQALRISRDSSLPGGTLTGAFSPTLGPLGAGDYTVSVDVSIGSLSGANYGVVAQAPSQGLLTARVEFDFAEHIWAVDNLGSGLQWVDTGHTWDFGVYRNLTIDVNSLTNSIKYYYNGSLIYTGAGGIVGGTSVEQVVLYSDNFQLNEAGDFDNLTVTPEPGALALMALGCLTLFRRR